MIILDMCLFYSFDYLLLLLPIETGGDFFVWFDDDEDEKTNKWDESQVTMRREWGKKDRNDNNPLMIVMANSFYWMLTWHWINPFTAFVWEKEKRN